MPKLPLKRRTWLKLLAALAARPRGGVAQAPAASKEPPQRVTKEMLAHALETIGLEFSEAHQAMMLPGVNRALAQYEALRKIEIPSETEPAFRFTPRLPGATVRSGPARFQPTRMPAPKSATRKSPDELAFLP